MEKFEFNPVKGFEDGSAYPNPSNEAEVRTQLMRPLFQLQAFLNDMIEKLNSSEGIKEIGTEKGSLLNLLEDYVLQAKLTEELNKKLNASLGNQYKGMVLYINDEGVITPVSIDNIGSALTEDVVMKFQGKENAGKVLVVDQGGQVIPVMGFGTGTGASSFYDISIHDDILEINCVLTNELKVTDDGEGNVTLA